MLKSLIALKVYINLQSGLKGTKMDLVKFLIQLLIMANMRLLTLDRATKLHLLTMLYSHLILSESML